jgi:hypothetical protein
MELFLPTLLTIVLAGIVVFVVMPKLSPYILGVMALAMLLVGAYQHYTMFPYEYQTSRLLDTLKDYTPVIMIGVLIMGLLINVLWAFGIQTPAVSEVMPNVAKTLNQPVAMPNLGLGGNSKNQGGIMNTLGLGGNSRPANNKGLLGGIMGNNKNQGTKFTTV